MFRKNHAGIIVIDGADGVGKSTQFELLKKTYLNCEFTKFPNYNSDTGFFISKYLNGDLNHVFEGMDEIDKVNKISKLYAMDRVLWFGTSYNKYKNLICDRYTTSNIIHMSALIINSGGTIDDVYNYIDTLENLEYNILNIPEPDLVIYLDASPKNLMNNLSTSREVLDVLENESNFRAIESVKNEIIIYCGWAVVKCDDENGMRPIEEINNDIKKIIDAYLNKK